MNDTAPAKPSPVVLLYVFGDRLIPKGNLLGSMAIPGTDAKVASQELVPEMVACALWTLRREGYIAIDEQTKTVLFMKHHEINIKPLKPVANLSGLEGDLGRRVGGGIELGQLLRNTYGETNTVYQTISHQAYQTALDAGYLRQTGGGIGDKLRNAITGSGKTERVPEAIAALEPEFAAFQTEWSAFKTSEAELFDGLVKRARTSINALAPTTSVGD